MRGVKLPKTAGEGRDAVAEKKKGWGEEDKQICRNLFYSNIWLSGTEKRKRMGNNRPMLLLTKG